MDIKEKIKELKGFLVQAEHNVTNLYTDPGGTDEDEKLIEDALGIVHSINEGIVQLECELAKTIKLSRLVFLTWLEFILQSEDTKLYLELCDDLETFLNEISVIDTADLPITSCDYNEWKAVIENDMFLNSVLNSKWVVEHLLYLFDEYQKATMPNF